MVHSRVEYGQVSADKPLVGENAEHYVYFCHFDATDVVPQFLGVKGVDPGFWCSKG